MPTRASGSGAWRRLDGPDGPAPTGRHSLTVSRLAIFDIDGTLTATSGVDNDCFLVAMARALGVPTDRIDWGEAPHVTDTGILEWLCDRHHNRAPTRGERQRAKTELADLLARELATSPARFSPIPGACEVFGRLAAAGWALAMATGCWDVSARLKLGAATIPFGQIPLICSDDAPERAMLLRRAIAGAEAQRGARFERIVSIGDGLWDVAAAITVGIPFVGIATGERAVQLRGAGATEVLPDLGDAAALCRALERARVPAPLPA